MSAVRRERPTDIGNPLPPHRATFIHVYRRPPMIRFKKLKAKKGFDKRMKIQQDAEENEHEAVES